MDQQVCLVKLLHQFIEKRKQPKVTATSWTHLDKCWLLDDNWPGTQLAGWCTPQIYHNVTDGMHGMRHKVKHFRHTPQQPLLLLQRIRFLDLAYNAGAGARTVLELLEVLLVLEGEVVVVLVVAVVLLLDSEFDDQGSMENGIRC
ncbi:hypothetical protein E2C01_024005 [Portunus trituberculatus]|uniref:Uncharacterized protein n=1 Tax=Portunus trituberculatus TaxID=210409 RepID=A0A5B7EC16_PORTR|nr:hypothetical protein [Portunus trituberculatus]